MHYLQLFDLEDRTLLTIGSSCDQAINAILHGAKDITVFDICPFVKEYYYLKKAAILALSIDEFMNFFCYKNYSMMIIDNKMAFDMDIYLKIRNTLKSYSDDILYFWDMIFFKYNGIVIRRQMFSTDENRSMILRKINDYLCDEGNYLKLRKIIDNTNIEFVRGDIFTSEITKKYDNIFLSNLACYHSLANIKELFLKMHDHLNDEGKMLLAYLYETTEYSDDYMSGEPEIYDIPRVKRTFPKEIVFDSFLGVSGIRNKMDDFKDSVITYKKVKKI